MRVMRRWLLLLVPGMLAVTSIRGAAGYFESTLFTLLLLRFTSLLLKSAILLYYSTVLTKGIEPPETVVGNLPFHFLIACSCNN